MAIRLEPLPEPIGLKSDMQQSGGAVKHASDYVTGRFQRIVGRAESLGLTLRWTPLNAISRISAGGNWIVNQRSSTIKASAKTGEQIV
jgi:hypothetical protein